MSLRLPIPLVALAAILAGCTGSDAGGGDASAEADAGTDADADTDADAGECESSGTWEDPGTGLTWQDGPWCEAMGCAAAIAYCDALELGGQADWRLPSIGELRSLVRGCEAIEPGGACGVTDDCLDIDCWDLVCYGYGCGAGDGPGTAGCYWDPDLVGECGTYWSSPVWNNGVFDACWHISFEWSYLDYVEATNALFARCVRGPGG